MVFNFNKEKFISLKNELKLISKELKELKLNYKFQQSKISKENLDCWGTREERDFFSNHWNIDAKIKKLRFNFRHKHIAYCLMKGREYEEIERFVREDNKPDWNIIKGIQDETSN